MLNSKNSTMIVKMTFDNMICTTWCSAIMSQLIKSLVNYFTRLLHKQKERPITVSFNQLRLKKTAAAFIKGGRSCHFHQPLSTVNHVVIVRPQEEERMSNDPHLTHA